MKDLILIYEENIRARIQRVNKDELEGRGTPTSSSYKVSEGT